MGPVLRTHWGLDDPGHVVGTDDDIEAAFERTSAIILERVQAFLALPLDDLRQDKPRFKAELDRIGTLVP
jgi:arsenate reductase